MLDLIGIFLQVTERLEKSGISYMVVGSVASMTYGEARMTHDLDLVVKTSAQNASRFETLFPLEEFYCPPEEVVKHEILSEGQFNLIHHESGLKIDIVICKNSEHAKVEFGRRRQVSLFNGQHVSIATPEDVIIKKLEYFREGGSQKHLRDIRGILAESSIDQVYLSHWIEKLGLQSQWAEVT